MADDWDWVLADRAKREIEKLDEYAQDRIIEKLDEIVSNEWRDPPDFLKPLEGAPHDKLRIGQFRLGCRPDREKKLLYILRIQKRGGDAYRGDD